MIRATGQAYLWVAASLPSLPLSCEDSASSFYPLAPQPLPRFPLPGFRSFLFLVSPRLSAPLQAAPQSPVLSSLSSHPPQLRFIIPWHFPCLRQCPFCLPSLGSEHFCPMQSAKTPLPKS